MSHSKQDKDNPTEQEKEKIPVEHHEPGEFPAEHVSQIIAWYRNPTSEGKWQLIEDHGHVLVWIGLTGKKATEPMMLSASRYAGTEEEKINKIEQFLASHKEVKSKKKTGPTSKETAQEVGEIPAWFFSFFMDITKKLLDKLFSS